MPQNLQAILELTKPILYSTDYEKWPYAYAGTCFPIKWANNLYLVSALHCYFNHNILPKDTLYPIPNTKGEFLDVSSTYKISTESEYEKFQDLVVIEIVATEKVKSQINALDLTDFGTLISPWDPNILDIWLRGFMFSNPKHKIDYDLEKITQQAYLTNHVTSIRLSPWKHCAYLKFLTPCQDNVDPNGISGSPVYAEQKNGKVSLIAMVIEYNELTGEYLVIEAYVINSLISKTI